MKKKRMLIAFLTLVCLIIAFVIGEKYIHPFYCSQLSDLECESSLICSPRFSSTGGGGGIYTLGLIYHGCFPKASWEY